MFFCDLMSQIHNLKKKAVVLEKLAESERKIYQHAPLIAEVTTSLYSGLFAVQAQSCYDPLITLASSKPYCKQYIDDKAK